MKIDKEYWKDTIKDWWYVDMYTKRSKFDDIFIHPFRKIKYGIQNLWYWRKVIWNDRDWDYYFLSKMIVHKMKRMDKHFLEYSNHVNREKDVRKMRCFYKRLERAMNNDYMDVIMKDHREKWGEIQMTSEPYHFYENGKPKTYRTNFSYSNVKTEEENKQACDQAHELYNKCEKARYDDIRKAGRAFGRWFTYWWW